MLVTLALLLSGCSSSSSPSLAAAGTTTCRYTVTGGPARPVQLPPSAVVPTTGTAAITLNLTNGAVHLSGDRADAPCTLNSFESLATQGYFDGTTCHRLADWSMFLVQCGDPTGTGRGGPGYRFDDELNPSARYTAGTVAMASAGADTNGSQFFIIYRDSELPPDYTVFAHVDAASLTVIEQLAAAGHDNSYGDGTGRPLTPFTITSVAVA